jgi:hypothetical protein
MIDPQCVVYTLRDANAHRFYANRTIFGALREMFDITPVNLDTLSKIDRIKFCLCIYFYPFAEYMKLH